MDYFWELPSSPHVINIQPLPSQKLASFSAHSTRDTYWIVIYRKGNMIQEKEDPAVLLSVSFSCRQERREKEYNIQRNEDQERGRASLLVVAWSLLCDPLTKNTKGEIEVTRWSSISIRLLSLSYLDLAASFWPFSHSIQNWHPPLSIHS